MTEIQRAFVEKLYAELRPDLITFAAAYFRNSSPVDDVIQELYMRTCENVETLMRHENPKGWMVATLKNIMRDTYKERARNKSLNKKVQQATYVQHGKTPAHTVEGSRDYVQRA